MSAINAVAASKPYATPPATVLVNSQEAVDDTQAAYNPSAVNVVSSSHQDIDKVSTDFEAVFLTQMMQQMFAGDELTNYFGGGTTGEVYKSYLLNEYGKSIAKAGGIGIASQVKQELLKLQETTR